MTRKQTEIPGFERQVENPAVEEACVKWLEVTRQRAELSKKEAQAKAAAQATMQAHGYTEYRFWDDVLGGYRPARIDTKETIVIDKDIEHDDPPGESVEAGEDPGPSEGLLADAAKAQKDANVAEDPDGDIVVPDEAPPAKKRGGRKSKGK